MLETTQRLSRVSVLCRVVGIIQAEEDSVFILAHHRLFQSILFQLVGKKKYVYVGVTARCSECVDICDVSGHSRGR